MDCLDARPTVIRCLRNLLAWLATCAGICLLPAAAAGQTCASPAVFMAHPEPVPVYGNTLNGETSLNAVCQDAVALPGPAYIYRIRAIPGATAQIHLTDASAGYTPVMYVTRGSAPCGTGECLVAVDRTTPIRVADLPPGEHWLLVTAGPADPPGAGGNFTLNLWGSWDNPDLVFFSGFD